MDDMEVIIRSHGAYAYGNERIEDVAQEWRDYDFAPTEADAWLGAGCFRAPDARELADNDITPEMAAVDTMEGIGKYKASVAYKFANNDLTMEQILAILRH